VRGHRGLWWTFGAGAVLVVLALGWTSWMVLGLEQAGNKAQAEAEHQESLRLALWRMESRLVPFTVREVARPYFQYESYYPQQQVHSPSLEPRDVLTPSPLLLFHSDTVRLHFQIDPRGGLSSPQVPLGAQRNLALYTPLTEADLQERQAILDELRPWLEREELLARVDRAELEVGRRLSRPESPPVETIQALKSQAEFQKRVSSSSFCQAPLQPGAVSWDPSTASSVVVGTLVPLWVGNEETLQIVFVRVVTIGSEKYLQGFLADWQIIREDLLAEVRDLFPDAGLWPILEDRSPTSSDALLAGIPAVLEVTRMGTETAVMTSPARVSLVLTWLAALVALLAVAMTLRSSMAFAERRRRFVSAVTHELRTPLTTFRMYSEMLADGIVKDPEAQQEYLETLKEESERLTTIVENVLAYARLEEGKASGAARLMEVDALVQAIRTPLQRRAEACDGSVSITLAPEAHGSLEVDADAVGQILFNLVDNACKYGGKEGPPSIRLYAGGADGLLTLEVQDDGPGVPAGEERVIFEPFERGAGGSAHGESGVGLGLALARDLARSLGGELKLMVASGGGARFRLTLPGLLRTERHATAEMPSQDAREPCCKHVTDSSRNSRRITRTRSSLRRSHTMKIHRTASLLVFLLLFLPPATQAASRNAPVVLADSRPVDLVICLDTSGSMEELLDSARARVWDIVNEFARMRPTPYLRVGLLSYGSDDPATEEDGWITLHSDLTDDLDAIYAELMALRTSGSVEHVGRVLDVAVREMDWSPAWDGLRLVFVAGNESADQGMEEVDFRDVALDAGDKDILINALYAGNREQGVGENWHEVAQHGHGNFSAIDVQRGIAQISTPHDERLLRLNASLNDTYLAYGERGADGLANQLAQDNNASRLGVQSCSSRIVAKGSALYTNASWDLVDAMVKEDFSLASLRTQDLPEEMQGMDQQQRLSYVEAKRAQREDVQQQIQELSDKREAFLVQAKKDELGAQGLDDAIRQAIREQAKAKGFTCDGC